MIASTLAYALQGTFLAGFFRRYDLLTVVAFRGLALLIVMSPLLFFQRAGAWSSLPDAGGFLVAACIAAAMANACAGTAMRHLAVGISAALTQSLSAFFTVVSGLVIMNEHLTLSQGLFALLLIAVIAILGLSHRGAPQGNARPLLGIAASVGCGIFMATALTCLVQVTRRVDPLFAAWAWEGGIGIVAGLALLTRRLARIGSDHKSQWPGMAVFARIGIVSSPTLIGTGCYALATQTGGIALASAILSTIMVGTSVLARFVYHEKLSLMQWLLIAAACASVIGLRLT